MIQPTDVIVFGLAVALGVYLWHPSLLRRTGLRNRRSQSIRVFALLFAVSLLFQTEPLAARFDEIIGINNASWVVGYTNSIVAIYAGMLAIINVEKNQSPSWLNVLTIVVLAMHLVIAPSLFACPEQGHNELPTCAPALAIRESLYLYLMLVAIFGIRKFHEWFATEQSPTGRVRGRSLTFAFACGFIFCIIRGVAGIVNFSVPGSLIAEPALELGNYLLIGCAAGITVGLLPVASLRWPVLAAVYVEQQLTLLELERLQGRLRTTTGEMPWRQPSFRKRWTNVPHVLYCTEIDILDRHALLRARIARGDGRINSRHRQLAARLDALPKTSGWVELAKYLRRVAREL